MFSVVLEIVCALLKFTRPGYKYCLCFFMQNGAQRHSPLVTISFAVHFNILNTLTRAVEACKLG